MDDIIVIILTLIVALVGILNKKKKKAEAQAPVTETSKESPDFWDMIMDADEVQQENVQEYVEPEPVVEIPKKPKIKSDYQFSSGKEGSSAVKKKMKEVVKTRKKAMIEGEEFSLRKAVIYNEILNRKYS